MDLPLGAEVISADGKKVGRCSQLIVNPVSKSVSHFVVDARIGKTDDRVVPLDVVAESTTEHIRLRITEAELQEAEAFYATDYVEVDETLPYEMHSVEGGMMLPYAHTESRRFPQDVPRIPPGELAVRRGADVHATDGKVGEVNEFLVDQEDGHITHLILREGHLWGKKDVTIPVGEIDRIGGGAVYLKIDGETIAELPAIKVKRWWS